MKSSVDDIIKMLEDARAEHRRVFNANGDLRKSNNDISVARALAFAELGMPIQAVCNDKLLEMLRERSMEVARAKREQDIVNAKTIWQDLEPGDIRRIVAYVCKQTDSTAFPSFEVFSKLIGNEDKTLFTECQHVHAMYIGKWAGWWELSWDMFDTDCDLYPIQLVTVSLSNTEHKGFASLLAELGLFKSSSEAKKNGWNKPLEVGDYFFKKKTYILRIIV